MTDICYSAIKINSQFASQEDSSGSAFHINLGSRFEPLPGSTVAVTSFTFVNSFLGLPEGSNTLYLTETVGTARSFTVTVPPGNYSTTEAQTAIDTAVNAASVASGWSLTYAFVLNSNTGFLTITITGASGANIVVMDLSSGSSLWNYIGFPNTGTTTFNAGNGYSVTGTNIINFLGQNEINLSIPEFDSSYISAVAQGNFNPSSIIFSTPVTVSQWEIQNNQPTILLHAPANRTLTRISFRITDPYYNLIRFAAGTYVSIVLSFFTASGNYSTQVVR